MTAPPIPAFRDIGRGGVLGEAAMRLVYMYT
jgi:hypothetical protein